MRSYPIIAASFLLAITILTAFTIFPPSERDFKMPYRAAHLTDRQAAAHLLSRFTFGARPGEVDSVLKIGIKNWFFAQLDAANPEDTTVINASNYPDLTLSNSEVLRIFPNQGEVIRMAIRDSVINKDSINQTGKGNYKALLATYMKKKGIRSGNELYKELVARKIYLATFSKNQLKEVMTDFWFNHFNVSLQKPDCARFIPNFERDAIRPHVLGNFQDLLLATAKSPAMLFYLDNFSSAYTDTTQRNFRLNRIVQLQRAGKLDTSLKTGTNQTLFRKRNAGLNENYAREVMELHTLGVDGGYTQTDVTEAARVLTGWTIYPISDLGPVATLKKLLDNMNPDQFSKRGFVRDGDFLFAPGRHDPGNKIVLGYKFPSGLPSSVGYQEGLDLLNMLAHHPSTANFISRKLAIRFVCDNPPKSLIDKMSTTFLRTNGNIREVLITMVSSPEFWNTNSIREKTKSPFEYAISAVRSLNAQIVDPVGINYWLTRMGEQIYYYQAPTGFPDQGAYWINTGALLNRMNFGLLIASGRINGIKVNLLALNHNHEPESNEAALLSYSTMMLPERNLDQTLQRLTPLLNHPNLDSKISDASGSVPVNNIPFKPTEKNNGLSQVVGIIIGSPEFQRR